MLTAADFLDDEERQHIYNVAPGKGNKPLSIFREYFLVKKDLVRSRDSLAYILVKYVSLN